MYLNVILGVLNEVVVVVVTVVVNIVRHIVVNFVVDIVNVVSNVVKIFKQCEKYEIACQGDDHADKELRATNSEALLYSRAAAVIAGQEECLRATRQRLGDARFNAWLATLPFIGANRARQISEILTSGTCEALESFRRAHREEAARALISNHANVVADALNAAPKTQACGPAANLGARPGRGLAAAWQPGRHPA